jgi:membrane protease YdiL (CAAX protease family)
MNENNNPNFDFYSFNARPQEENTTSAPEEEDFTPAPGEPVVWSAEEGEAVAAPIDLTEQKGKMRRGYSRVGWAFVGITVVWLLSSIILQSVAMIFAPELLDAYWFNIVTGTVPLYVICTPLLFLLLQGATQTSPEKKKLPVSHFFLLLLIAETVMMAGNLIGNSLMNVLGLLTGNDFQNQLNETFDLPLRITFLFTVILAPIFEELIFRKLLLDRMLPYGTFCAILFNGILFGAFHGNFFQFFYAAALGMLLAFLYSKTGKIHHCILIHMCVNFLGGVLPTILYDWLDYDTMLSLMEDEAALTAYITEHLLPYLATMVYSAAQYGLAIAGAIIFTVNLRYFKLEKSPDLLSNKKGFVTALLTPGMIASIVVCIALFAISLASSVAA